MTRRNLSENFKDFEFACRCSCGLLLVDQDLLDSLEELRSLVEKPIYVLSGCRCLRHNAEVGGSPRSQHLVETFDRVLVASKAADIYISGMRPRQMFQAAMKIEGFRSGGLGIYEGQGFIHVDVRGPKGRWFIRDKGSGMEMIPRNYY